MLFIMQDPNVVIAYAKAAAFTLKPKSWKFKSTLPELEPDTDFSCKAIVAEAY